MGRGERSEGKRERSCAFLCCDGGSLEPQERCGAVLGALGSAGTAAPPGSASLCPRSATQGKMNERLQAARRIKEWVSNVPSPERTFSADLQAV